MGADRARTPGNSLEVNAGHFCSVWAPHINKIRDWVYLLGISATRQAPDLVRLDFNRRIEENCRENPSDEE